MTRQTISLNGSDWTFGPVSCRPFTALNVNDVADVAGWLPATVPGHVRTDLLAHRRIPNPYHGENWQQSLWVEDVDWWYRRTVALAAPPASDQRVFIRFCGIDYRSAIFVNGRELTRHEGMFSRQTIDITAAARRGPIDLAVRLWGSSALPRRRLSPLQKLWKAVGEKLYRSWVGIYADRTATLKSQMSFGWDFAPPLRTMGIWDDVSLIVTGPLFIEEPGVRVQESGDRKKLAVCNLQLALNSAGSTPATALVTLTPANFDGPSPGPFRFPLHLPAGHSRVTLRCPLPEVAPWQPWDRGFPHLYDVTLTLTSPAGAPLDSVTVRTGFRTATQATNPPPNQPAPNAPHSPNSLWQFAINGQREFLRGLNWVPADSFPGRLRRADYERLLTLARHSGANMLRVWGGGLREKRAFYDLCDELGLLVWQEFPFACEFLGAYPRDADYLAFVDRECSDIVRQVRHHPSLLLWCGGNEFSRRRNRPLLHTLARVVRREDGARPFIPTSPGPGDAHNWRVWHGYAPISAYQQETAPMLSEFGLQSLPDSMSQEQLVMSNVSARHGDPRKLTRYADLFNEKNKKLVMNNEQSLAARCSILNSQFTIYHSQLAQAVGLQTAIEHMRRRREAGGLAVWQFNEPWPAVSWAIVDYFGRPKLAYERLKTWYAPLLVSLEFPVGRRWQPGDLFEANIWLINDSLQPVTDAGLHITLTTVHTSEFTIYQSQFLIPANSVACVGRLTHQFEAAPYSLTATLRRGDEILSENSYPLHWHDDRRAGLSLRLRRWLARLALW